MKRIFLFITLAVLMQACFFFEQKDEEVLASESKTEFVLINGTNDTVTVYLTLGSDTNCVNNVNGVFGIQGSGLQGSFLLYPNDTTNFTSPDGKSFEGNLSFGFAPSNCPDSLNYPLGINLFEFNLNDNFPYIQNPQETIDISCVAGANCSITCNVSDSTWNAGTTYPVVMNFSNSFLYENTYRVGVFPYGCDDCTASVKPPSCPNHRKYAQPQKDKICNVQRNASSSGGKVTVTFCGFLNGIPCEEK